MESTKSVLKYVIVGVIILGLGVGIGYNYLPARVVTETKVVEKIVEKIVEKTKQDEKTTTVIVENKDGSKTTTTTTDKTTVTDKNTDKDTNSQSDTVTTKEYATRWQTNAMYKQVIGDFNQDIKNFGVGVQYRVVGPLHVGGFGFLDKTVGVSVGLGF